MKAQKTIATAMILTGSMLTAWASRDITFPAILCILGLLGLQRRFTWDFRPERRVITSLLLLVLAILFALHYRYVGSRFGQHDASVFAWQTIARYFLACMILILFLGSPNRLPASLGLFYLAAAVAAGQVVLLDDMYIAFRLAELLAVTLLVLYAAADRGALDVLVRQRVGRLSGGVVSAFVLIFAANCGWVVGSALYRHVEILDHLPGWPWEAAIVDPELSGVVRVGFSDSGKLSSVALIKGEQDTTPVLSISCDKSPGYLRARAFEVYRQSEWNDLSYREAIFPVQNKPFGTHIGGRTNVFQLGNADEADAMQMTVRHEAKIGNAIFTPLGAAYLDAPYNLLLRDDDDILYPPNVRANLSYRIVYAPSARGRAPFGPQSNRMLDIPMRLDSRVSQLADRVFAGCETTSEKIAAVINHFHSNYTYQLGLEVPPEQDKLTYFLLEASSGYCEYFASGAVLMLRLAGVPARYVTGFLVTQKDEDGAAWVARNMDAHAWAEAWDQDRRQWVIVEATAQEALSEASTEDELGEASGSGYLLLRQLMEAVYQYGLFGVFAWLFASYRLSTGVVLAVSLLSAALYLRMSRRRRARRAEDAMWMKARPTSEAVALHKLLAHMDRKVRAKGHRRGLGETLHAFARRLRGQDDGDGRWTRIAHWYVEYAAVRYAPTIRAERLHHLKQRARRLRRFL
jgi:transglutaminase-like putative cysteine protease